MVVVMARGRKPQPTKLRLIKGNPGKRPIPENEPQPEAVAPEPPDHLSTEAREEWDRLAPALAGLGLLTAHDMATFGAYCQAYGRWRQAEKAMKGLEPVVKTGNGSLMQHPMVGIANRAAADVVKYAAEFGLTPSARARIGVDLSKKKDEWAGLLGGGAA